MALQKKQSSSSRFIVIGIIVVVVLGIGYLLFQQFYLGAQVNQNVNQSQSRTNRVITSFGEGILQDPRYKALIEYGTPPVNPTSTNPNPFQ